MTQHEVSVIITGEPDMLVQEEHRSYALLPCPPPPPKYKKHWEEKRKNVEDSNEWESGTFLFCKSAIPPVLFTPLHEFNLNGAVTSSGCRPVASDDRMNVE
jgi:hypothetical protein